MGNQPPKINKTYRQICVKKYVQYPDQRCREPTCDHEKIKVRKSGLDYGSIYEPDFIIHCSDTNCLCYRLCPMVGVPLKVDLDVDDSGFIKVNIRLEIEKPPELSKTKNLPVTCAIKNNNESVGFLSEHDLVYDLHLFHLSKDVRSISTNRLLFLRDQIPIETLTNWFLWWVHNHPTYSHKYNQQVTIELLQPDLYYGDSQHSFEKLFGKLFEEFLCLDTDKTIDNQLALFFWSEDGTSFEIHRLTPDQKHRYSMPQFSFLFKQGAFKSCPVSKVIERGRLQEIPMPKIHWRTPRFSKLWQIPDMQLRLFSMFKKGETAVESMFPR